MSELRKNTFILLLNNLLGGALTFCMSIVIGRGLGAEGLGQHAFIIAWIAPLTALGDFGLGSLLTRDVARDPGTAPALMYTVTRTFPLLGSAVLVGAWTLLAVSRLSELYTVGIALAATLVILDPWYGLYMALFRANGLMTPVLYLNVGGGLAQVGLMALVTERGLGVLGVVGVIVGVNLVQLIAAFGMWRVFGRYVPYRGESRPGRRELLTRMAPFTVSALITALGVRANILILERLVGSGGVGFYSAANRFLEAGKIAPNAFFGALFPALSALVERPHERDRLFRRSLALIGSLSVALAVTLSLGAGLFLRLTYGEAFRDAAPILSVLAWALVPLVLRMLVNLYLFSTRQEGLANQGAAIALSVQAALSVLLVTQYGVVGAAWAVLIAESVTLCGLAGVLAFRSQRENRPVDARI